MKKLLVYILLAAIIILTYKIWLPLPGTLLAVKDNFAKADCIVTLNGGPYFRIKTAAKLFKDGYAKNMVMSAIPKSTAESHEHYIFLNSLGLLEPNETSDERLILKAFGYFGIGPSDIHFTGTAVTSTYEEAIATKKFMIEKGFKSMILVTSAYHMRRAILTFEWVFRGTGIKIYNCSAENEMIDLHHWWRKEKDVRYLINEYISFIHNIIYHLILHKGRTSFDSA